MFESLQAPLFFGLIAAFVTTLGLLAVAMRSDWSLRHADLFGLVAAGMLTAIAFLHIVPEAFALSSADPVAFPLFESSIIVGGCMDVVGGGGGGGTPEVEAGGAEIVSGAGSSVAFLFFRPIFVNQLFVAQACRERSSCCVVVMLSLPTDSPQR